MSGNWQTDQVQDGYVPVGKYQQLMIQQQQLEHRLY